MKISTGFFLTVFCTTHPTRRRPSTRFTGCSSRTDARLWPPYKHSFNYYVRIMFYMRLRVLLKIFSRGGRWNSDRKKLTDWIQGVRGNQSARVWAFHYQNFLARGWNYLRAKNFVHHCTDGPECEYAYAFTKSEVRAMFSKFREVKTVVAHFPLKKYSRAIPFGLEKFLARRMGWYLYIFARK